jgi:putative ABC transport system permease protein
MKYAHLVWGNLRRKKLRTLLTLLSILVAFVLFGLLCHPPGARWRRRPTPGVDRLIVRHKVSIIQLLPAELSRRAWNASPAWTWSCTRPGSAACIRIPRIFHAEPGAAGALPCHASGVRAATGPAATPGSRRAPARSSAGPPRSVFGWKVGDRVPIRSPIWGQRTWEFDLVGIYEGRDKGTDTTPMLFFRYDYFDEMREEGRGRGSGRVVHDPRAGPGPGGRDRPARRPGI